MCNSSRDIKLRGRWLETLAHIKKLDHHLSHAQIFFLIWRMYTWQATQTNAPGVNVKVVYSG